MSLISREVVLASGSSARKQILEEAGVKFTVIVSNVDEDLHPHDEPEKYVTTLAARKAMAVVPRYSSRRMPSSRMGTTLRSEAAPTIPHMKLTLSVYPASPVAASLRSTPAAHAPR